MRLGTALASTALFVVCLTLENLQPVALFHQAVIVFLGDAAEGLRRGSGSSGLFNVRRWCCAAGSPEEGRQVLHRRPVNVALRATPVLLDSGTLYAPLRPRSGS